MAYKSGDAQLVTRKSLEDDGYVYEPESDADYLQNDSRGKQIMPPFVKLPHSCDAWVIGGPDAVRLMIAELMALLAEMER